MRQYIGTKIVIATAMTRAEYNIYRGWKLPVNEEEGDAGYLIEYQDGGKPNDDRHVGYISWSPAEQFERANVPFDARDDLAPHQLRVVAERADLDARAERLASFIMGDTFASLPADERDRLQRQRMLMGELSTVLAERIEAF